MLKRRETRKERKQAKDLFCKLMMPQDELIWKNSQTVKNCSSKFLIKKKKKVQQIFDDNNNNYDYLHEPIRQHSAAYFLCFICVAMIEGCFLCFFDLFSL